MTTTQTSTLPAVETWPEQGQWTREAWLRLPSDGWRYEVIDGELYMTPPPSPEHQVRSNELAYRMTHHVKTHQLGIVLTAPVGVRLSGRDVPIQPDIVFVSAARRSIIHEDHIEGAPDLVVEVLSPSNWAYDRKEKFTVYLSAGIPEYWIVDYRKRTIEVFVLEDGEYLLDQGVLHAGDVARSHAMAGFEVAVSDVFQPY